MNKKAIISIICIIILGIIGFFGYKFLAKNTEIEKNNTKYNEDINEGNQDTSINNISENAIGAYINAESLVDIKMGTCYEGSQKALCTVKMPTNYLIASLYRNQDGTDKTMSSTNGKKISDVLKDGGLDNPNEIPDTITLGGEGGSYSFAIGESNIVSVKSEKEYAPGGIDIVFNNIHNAYIHKSKEGYAFDYVFVYDINDKYSLVIQYEGDITNKISLQQFGQELYKIIATI